MPVNPLSLFTPGLSAPNIGDAVEAALEALNIDDEVIAAIVAVLDTSATDINDLDLPTLDQTDFGGSWHGRSMGHHTDLAQDHFQRALQSMVQTLSGNGERLRQFHGDVQFAEEDAITSTRAIEDLEDLVDPTETA